MRALTIRSDLSASELRGLAGEQKDPRVARRMRAIANALEGMSRAQAAAQVGLERQALRDAVVRYNAEGVDGLFDRPRSGRPPKLDHGRQAALKASILKGPDPEKEGRSRYRAVDLCELVEEEYGVSYTKSGMINLLRGLNLAWQKARQQHPRTDLKAQEAIKKKS